MPKEPVSESKHSFKLTRMLEFRDPKPALRSQLIKNGVS